MITRLFTLMEKKLIDFWSRYKPYKLHPDDQAFLGDELKKYCLDLSYAEVQEKYGPNLRTEEANKKFLANKDYTHKILTNMLVAPYLGDVINSKIYFLMTNPGFHTSIYDDEHKDKEYVKIVLENLVLKLDKFLCLDNKASKTLGYKYWSHRSRIPKISSLLAKLTNKNFKDTSQYLLKKFCLIESIAYHSIKKPNDLLLNMPSSQLTLELVQKFILEKAMNDKAIVFIWRGKSFWQLPKHKNIIIRSTPIYPFITDDEANQFAKFLAKSINM